MKKIFLILTLFGIFSSYSSYGQNMLKTAIITVSDAIIDSVTKDEVADNTQKRNQKIIQGKVYNLIPNYNVEKSSKEITTILKEKLLETSIEEDDKTLVVIKIEKFL